MAQFKAEIVEGSVYLGSPATVARKIAAVIRQLGLSRFDLGYATGRVSHEQKLATIELYGREVIPRVRELLSSTDQRRTATVPPHDERANFGAESPPIQLRRTIP